MTLTETEKELIETKTELIAERIIEKVVTNAIKNHIETCPTSRMFHENKKLFYGAIIMVVILSGGSLTSIVNLVINLFK